MDGVIDMEAARSLVANGQLWPLVRDFLWDFAPQVHVSWLDGLEIDGAKLETGSLDLSSPRVKSFILKALGVEPCFHSFPNGDWSRLLLLGAPALESIAKWLGALACAESLRCVTDGATVRSLKAGFAGVYPEVFSYTAYFSRMDFGGIAAKSADEVLSAGCKLLLSAFAALPSCLVSRIRFKFPKDSSFASIMSRPIPEKGKSDRRRGFMDNLISKLLKLRFPEVYSLCCS